MNVKVIFPEELLLALREDPESFRKKVLIFTLANYMRRVASLEGTAGTSTGFFRITDLPYSTTRTKSWIRKAR
ncbi:MAG: hypothetical protein LWX01_12915 [Deltaproteobacteria bacterium]|nr:hypothetical protein [Deltaproteobacteria bacterium]MDL1962566.1 hypothetical protein [Deltaproteobacteria bacterium]